MIYFYTFVILFLTSSVAGAYYYSKEADESKQAALRLRQELNLSELYAQQLEKEIEVNNAIVSEFQTTSATLQESIRDLKRRLRERREVVKDEKDCGNSTVDPSIIKGLRDYANNH